jgi:hypothetical protein
LWMSIPPYSFSIFFYHHLKCAYNGNKHFLGLFFFRKRVLLPSPIYRQIIGFLICWGFDVIFTS